jgi:hypothetical protein
MERSGATIVSLIYVHIFYSCKVVKWGGLVTLSRNVQHICAVHILSTEISFHNLTD